MSWRDNSHQWPNKPEERQAAMEEQKEREELTRIYNTVVTLVLARAAESAGVPFSASWPFYMSVSAVARIGGVSRRRVIQPDVVEPESVAEQELDGASHV